MSRETVGDPKWGREIKVNGVRPAWLGNDDAGLLENAPGRWLPSVEQNIPLMDWSWGAEANGGLGCPIRIRLPADHFAYRALDAGFEPWGRSEEPTDWDRGAVLLADGRVRKGMDWEHAKLGYDAIGYHKRAAAEAATDTVTIARMTEKEARDLFNSRAGLGRIGSDRFTTLLDHLGLIRSEPTPLDRFMTAHPDADRDTAEKALAWGREG